MSLEPSVSDVRTGNADRVPPPPGSPPGPFELALDAAQMGWWRHTLDDNVCIFSERAQQLYGLTSARFLHDVDNLRALIHPDDVDGIWRAIESACDPAGDGRYTVEYRVRRLEGGWRWLGVWGRVEFEGSGTNRRAVAITGASHDISDRKRSEAFLTTQKRSLEMIVSGAPVRETLSYLTRTVEEQADGRVVASILLLDDEGRLRNGASPSLPDDYLAAIDGLKAQPELGTCSVAAATGKVVLTPDIENDPKWAAIKHLPLGLGFPAAWSQPIIGRDGRVLGTFGTYFRERRVPTAPEREAVEILAHTAALAIERARSDEALRAADRRKDEFIATLSHELRNPLAPLRTGLHLLRASGTDTLSRERVLSTMDRQVSQLVRLVDDLLEVSRISRGALTLQREVLDVASIVRLAVETTEPALHAGRHSLTLELAPEPALVEGDRVRLAQVLANLLNNAAKYTDPGGRIQLRVRASEGEVAIAVRDNGDGIDPTTIPQLFEVFVRGPVPPGRSRDGLGVGLALARRLAEMHGGTLEGASDGPGRGSEFTLRLPRSRAAGASSVTRSGSRVENAALRSRVLVVDDNVDAAEMTAELLSQVGCEVRAAHDGASALAAAAELHPDVVFLDIGLPDMSGHEVCRALKREPWAAGTRVVALTGWGQTCDLADSRAAGFDAHQVKPVEPATIAKIVADHEASRARNPKP